MYSLTPWSNWVDPCDEYPHPSIVVCAVVMLTLVSALILVMVANVGVVTTGLTGSSSLHEVKKKRPTKANKINFECFMKIGFNWLNDLMIK